MSNLELAHIDWWKAYEITQNHLEVIEFLKYITPLIE